MLRWIVAAGLLVHGLIHLMGVVVSWQLGEVEGLTYSTRLIGGLDVGATGLYVVGAGWLLGAVGFAVSAFGLVRRASWVAAILPVVTLLSLVLSILESPEAIAGVVVNLVLLAGLVLVRLGIRPGTALIRD
ncbi:MAG: hypothetical protein Kow00129_10490 [Thermoleophilia bacterium]